MFSPRKIAIQWNHPMLYENVLIPFNTSHFKFVIHLVVLSVFCFLFVFIFNDMRV